MSIDPIDSYAGAETVNSLRGYGTDMAETARLEDQTYVADGIGDASDHQRVSDAANALDYARTGTSADPHGNILAAYFDGAGSIVNGYC